MEYNNELEKIDNEHKAYLLGLWFADGCITYNDATRISLVDKQIIDDLHILFPFFNKGEYDFSVYNINNKNQYSLSKKSKKLQQDLIQHGIKFRKSTTNAEQLRLPKLQDNLMNHFIRGYFDGNGSISVAATRPNLRRAEICASSKVFINDIKEYLQSININCPIYREKINTNSILYLLEWINSNDIITMREFLYNNSTISLKRKKDKFDSFRIISRTEDNPLCKVCNTSLKKNGTRQMKWSLLIRYKCTKCNTHSSIPVPNKKSDELLETPTCLYK